MTKERTFRISIFIVFSTLSSELIFENVYLPPQLPQVDIRRSQRYRVVKMQRMPDLSRSFSAQEPYNQWLFCGK